MLLLFRYIGIIVVLLNAVANASEEIIAIDRTNAKFQYFKLFMESTERSLSRRCLRAQLC